MYTPAHFAASEEAIEALLRNSGAANLVTMTPDGLLATLLPFIYDPSVGDHGALQTHMARNNPQWSTPVTGEALMILQGPDAYISPPGTPPRPSMDGWFPRGTTPPPTSTAGW